MVSKQSDGESRTQCRTNPNVMTRTPPGEIVLDAPDIQAIPWVDSPQLPGLSTKYLKVDLEQGVAVSLSKVAKGSRLPVHCHYSSAMIFCLQGRFGYSATGSIGAGGFLYEPVGTIHEPDTDLSDEDTVYFVVTNCNTLLQFYREDGSIGGVMHLPDRLRQIRKQYGEKALAHLNLPDWFWSE